VFKHSNKYTLYFVLDLLKMNYVWIIVIIVIIIIICVLENQYYQSGNKQSFRCPNKFEVETLKLDGGKTEKILIYNVKYLKDKSKLGFDENDYKYTYKPKILMRTRFTQPFKESLNAFKNINKDTMITDAVDGLLPYFNYVNNLLTAESNYRVLSNVPNLKTTSNEEYIYVKFDDEDNEVE